MATEKVVAIAEHLKEGCGIGQRQTDGSILNRTPAMAAGLERHPLTVTEILTTQVVGFCPNKNKTRAYLGYHPKSGRAP